MSELLSEKSVLVEKLSVISSIIWAFAPEFDLLLEVIAGLEELNSIDHCSGVLLDRIGQIVCLSRQEAGALIGNRELADNDEVYRILLKYKAMTNACLCTPDEIIEATEIIFGATEVIYSERKDVPATIFLSITAPLSDLVASILSMHDLIVRPAGVKVVANYSTEDSKTFGFADINPNVAGFGEGVFAQSVN